MARRKKKNPGVLGTTLIVLAVVGGLGYYAIQKGKKELKEGVKKAIKKFTESYPYGGWGQVTLKGLGDGRYTATVTPTGGDPIALGTFPNEDAARQAAEGYIDQETGGDDGSGLHPWDVSTIPPGSELVDQGVYIGALGPTEWRIYHTQVGPKQEFYSFVYRHGTGTGMVGMLPSMAAAQAELEKLG